MSKTASPPIIHQFSPQTPDSLFVEVQRLGKDHAVSQMGLHGHTFFELVLIERGGGRHRVGGRSYEAGPGDLYVISPGEVHDCTHIGPSEGWLVLFTPQALEGDAASVAFCWSWLPRHPLLAPFLALSRRQQGPIRLGADRLERWRTHIGEMAVEAEARAPGYQYGIHAHLSLLLLDLCRLIGSSPQAEPMRRDPVMETVFDFIDQNYRHPIGLADLAKAAGRSAAHLTTILRQRTGLTAHEWITERRMGEARRLLVQSDQTLEQIAAAVGYSETGSLVRSFLRLHKLTPAAWRKTHRTDPANN